jgi:hypothetical protein
MKKGENFYRRDPNKALAGMASLTLEERGVYNTVLDMLYQTWRPLEDDRRFIANWCNCAVQKLNPIIGRLIEKGRLITFEEGGRTYISDEAFEAERAKVKGASPSRSGRGQKREKSGEVEEKSEGVRQNHPLLDADSQEKQSVTALEKNREEKNSVPNGTGETPSSNEPSDDLAELRGLEPKAAAWALSRKVLCERGGLTRAKAGEIVGKLFRDHGLSPGELWEAAEATWKAGTENPVPYLTRLCASAASKRGGADNLEPSERQQIAWMEDWIESPSNWRGTRGPRPGEPGCRVRPEIQFRFGVQPKAVNDDQTQTSTGEAA